MTLQKESSWFAAANDLEAMFRDWTRQDDEYGSAMMQLEPCDRDQANEERERAKINATREKLIRQRIMAIPEIAELVKALEDSIKALSSYIPKAARGHKEGCFKYVAGGHDMWNCTCPICKARSALTRANEIKI